MNETMLINPQSAGMPAPIWFVQFFKALGFTLHMVPMNLWFAGLLLALWLHWRGGPHGRCFAGRLIKQMPVIVALGVNFGIVPLLFIQLAYYKVFYPATILMAWYWLAIVVLLIPAYYGIYIYAWGLAGGRGAGDGGDSRFRVDRCRRGAAGCIALLRATVAVRRTGVRHCHRGGHSRHNRLGCTTARHDVGAAQAVDPRRPHGRTKPARCIAGSAAGVPA